MPITRSVHERPQSCNGTDGSEDERPAKKQKIEETNENQGDHDRTPAAVSQHMSPNQKAIESFSALMNSVPDDAEHVKHTLCYLEHLVARDALNLDHIVDADGIAPIRAAMMAHRGDLDLQKQGCMLLLSVMKNLPADAELQVKCCRELYNSIYSNQETVQPFVDAGGIDILVASMKGHPNSASLQKYGLGIFRWLTKGNVPNKNRIVNAGGIKAITNAMTTHPNNTKLQTTGLCVLENLLIQEANVKPIVDANGISLASYAMTKYPADARVQRRGCVVLWYIAAHSNGEYTKQIVGADAIALAITAMKSHQDDKELQSRACKLFFFLSKDRREVKDKIIEAGGLESISTAIRIHRLDAVLQEVAKYVLTSVVAE